MELVSASKMRKTVQQTVASRAYTKIIKELTADVRALVDPATHPLLAGRKEARNTLVIVAASDRSLCGGFNAQVLKKMIGFLKDRSEKISVATVGKRAEISVKRTGNPIVAAFEAISNAPSYERAKPVGDFAYRTFMDGDADRVFVVYTDFQSALIQIPTILQLLPIIPEADLPAAVTKEADDVYDSKILFEPDPRSVLDRLLPRLIETLIYQALLESAASEHAARMMAMRSATDNATGMIDDLTLTFNQARQSNITREISEISAGKAALE